MIKRDRNAERYLPAGLDRFCQLIGAQAANLLLPGSQTKTEESIYKRSRGGWLVNKTFLCLHETPKKKKRKKKESATNFRTDPEVSECRNTRGENAADGVYSCKSARARLQEIDRDLPERRGGKGWDLHA